MSFGPILVLIIDRKQETHHYLMKQLKHVGMGEKRVYGMDKMTIPIFNRV